MSNSTPSKKMNIFVLPEDGSGWLGSCAQFMDEDTIIVKSPTPRVRVDDDGKIWPDYSKTPPTVLE